MIRMIRRTVPRPTYMASLLSVGTHFFRHLSPQTSRPNREGAACECRLEIMSPRLLIRIAFLLIALLAVSAALSELALGRRPVLLGGRAL